MAFDPQACDRRALVFKIKLVEKPTFGRPGHRPVGHRIAPQTLVVAVTAKIVAVFRRP